MVISAYTVSSDPRGFLRCEWPVTTRKRAEVLARDLSLKHADSTAYPNAFWVSGGKPICKYFKGVRYDYGVSL